MVERRGLDDLEIEVDARWVGVHEWNQEVENSCRPFLLFLE